MRRLHFAGERGGRAAGCSHAESRETRDPQLAPPPFASPSLGPPPSPFPQSATYISTKFWTFICSDCASAQ